MGGFCEGERVNDTTKTIPNYVERTNEWVVFARCVSNTGSKQLHTFSAIHPRGQGERFDSGGRLYEVVSCEWRRK